MPIGVGAALLIGSAVSAGTAAASAKVQSNAAKKAAQSQQTATNQALAVQQQANQPYMDLGKQALGTLGQMQANAQPYTQTFTGPGGSNGAQPFTPAQMGQKTPKSGTLAELGQQPAQNVPVAPPKGGVFQSAMQHGAFGGVPQGPPQGPPPMAPQAPQGPPQAGGPMVQLQAPDGSVRPFPAAQADAVIAAAQARGHQLRRVG